MLSACGSKMVDSDCYHFESRFEEIGYYTVLRGQYFDDCWSYLVIPHEVLHFEVVQKMARFVYEISFRKNLNFCIEITDRDKQEFNKIREMRLWDIYAGRRSAINKVKPGYFDYDPIEKTMETRLLRNRPIGEIIELIDLMEIFEIDIEKALRLSRKVLDLITRVLEEIYNKLEDWREKIFLH